jgi:hypothetical protein
VANPVEVLDHRDARLARQALDQFLAAARDDDVDVLGHRDQLADRRAVGRRDRLHRVLREPGAAQPGAHARSDRLVRLQRFGASPQDAGVPRLETQAAASGGDVRPRLVDDADDAERHAHASDLDSARAAHQFFDPADRIVERGDLLEALRHLLDRFCRQCQPVHERLRRVRIA